MIDNEFRFVFYDTRLFTVDKPNRGLCCRIQQLYTITRPNTFKGLPRLNVNDKDEWRYRCKRKTERAMLSRR